MSRLEGELSDSRAEIIRLTGRTPSNPYNHWKNQQIQKNITKIAVEARKKHLSYGQLQAQRYMQGGGVL